MPKPKPTWPLACASDVEARPDPPSAADRGSRRRGTARTFDPSGIRTPRAICDLTARRAEERLHGANPSAGLPRRHAAAGSAATQSLPLVRMLRERQHQVADAVDRRVDAGGKERAHESFGFLRRAIAPIGSREDLYAPASGLQVLAPAGERHPGRGLAGRRPAARSKTALRGPNALNTPVAYGIRCSRPSSWRPIRSGNTASGKAVPRSSTASKRPARPAFDQFVGPMACHRGATARKRTERDDAVHQAARAIVQRRIGFQQQRRWA